MKRIGTDKEDQGNDFVEETIDFSETEENDDAADDKEGRQ